MNKYHINPTTGAPGKCSAKVACPFGGPDQHYPSTTAAQAGFEAQMMATRNGGLGSLKADSPIALESILNPEFLLKDMAAGFIAARPHEADPALQILCYTKEAQFAGHWTEATKVARGLIIRSELKDFSDAVILERPWRKFFTLEQLQDGNWVLGDEEREGDSVEAELSQIDFNAKVEVTDKVDGSLGILYLSPDGLPALSTKGSFASEQANYYTAMLRRNETLLYDATRLLAEGGSKTHLFELVGPENRVVVDYDHEDIVLLGSVEKATGKYLSAEDEKAWTGEKVELLPAATIAEAFALPDRPNREGVVIRIMSDDPRRQMQLKVKQEDYKRTHRLIASFSFKDLRESVRSSPATFEDMFEAAKTGDIGKLPGMKEIYSSESTHPVVVDMMAKRKVAVEEAILPKAELLWEAKKRIDAIPAESFSGDAHEIKKEFATDLFRTVKDKDLARHMLNFFNARIEGRDLNEQNAGRILSSAARDLVNNKLEFNE